MRSNSLNATQQRIGQSARPASDKQHLPLTQLESELRHALRRLQASAAARHDLQIDLPAPGLLRMRTLVHRGVQRPVFKITSVKLGRVVHCESPLEVDLVLQLDADPKVVSFAEQPARLRYQNRDAWRSHVPDFAISNADGKLILAEVKFEKDVDEDVRERTRWIEACLPKLGAEYRLLTERSIRAGSAVQNASRVLRRARHTASEADLLRVLETLRGEVGLTLDAFGWNVPASQSAICIARLILNGKAAVDLRQPLSGSSRVWSMEGSHKEECAS